MKIVKFILVSLCLFLLIGCDRKNDEIIEENTKYSVNILECENGSVTSDKTEALPGQFVIFTINPSEGYELDKFYLNNEEVIISSETYEVFDVRENLNVSATFKKCKFKVRFFDESGSMVLYQKFYNEDNSEIKYQGSTPTKKTDKNYYYEFVGWYTKTEGGEEVVDFNFSESMDLFARFTKYEYSVSFDENVELNIFEEKQLNVTTNLPNPTIKYLSSNKEIASVSKDGIIKSNGEGSAKITISINGIEYVSNIVVKVNKSLYTAKKVYGSGYVSYQGNVGTIYSSQATIVDSNDKELEYEFLDYSLDMMIDNTTTGNFGLVFNKSVNSSGMATSYYQFNFEVGNSKNIKLYRDNVVVVETSYNIEVGKLYNFRVVTAPAINGKVKVVCYINNQSVIDTETEMPSGNGKQCGIRLANMVTNRFINLNVIDNIPSSLSINVLESENGSVRVDEETVSYKGSVVVTVLPNNGYYLKSLYINDVDVVENVYDSCYIYKNVKENLTIKAEFEPIPSEEVTISLNYSSYELYALESFMLVATTQIENPNYVWSSSDTSVVTVEGGKVFAVGSGSAIVTASIGEVSATCNVIVKVAEGYSFKAVYGTVSGLSSNNGVYTISKGLQADLYENGSTASLKYFEIELNMILGCDVGTGAKLGFQIHKTKENNGSLSSCYMVKPMTTAQVANDNIRIAKDTSNSTSTDKVKNSYELQVGVTYRVKIIVTQVEGATNIKTYIDGNLVSEYTDALPLTGTLFGLRVASLLDSNKPHKFAIVSVVKY